MSHQAETAIDFAELAGGFIHEIKNHVGTLNLNLQILAETFANPTTPQERRAKNRIDRLREECQKIVDISNDFLRFTRAQELRKVLVHIEDIVEEIIAFFEPTVRQANINLVWHPAPGVPRVFVDPDLIKQSLLNLMINAEQAMPNGGNLTLVTRQEQGAVVIEMIDTGCGMEPEVLKNLFSPFFTTKPGGTGLGLPTVKRIIQAHGGTIDVESVVGLGTKFTLRIPITALAELPNKGDPPTQATKEDK
ncbi:MAG: ATP-binding protein [Gemmataceae bacterium]|nr:ATP-binding protein [Gemmataceae bacterium]